MPPSPSRLLPALIGLTALATLGTGVGDLAFGSSSSASKAPSTGGSHPGTAPRAGSDPLSAYRAALRPHLEAVFDQLQPVEDALDDVDRPGGPSASFYDLARHAQTAPALHDQRVQTAALTIPPAQAADADRLDSALSLLETDAQTLTRAARTTGNDFASTFSRGESAFDGDTGKLSASIMALYDVDRPSYAGRNGGDPKDGRPTVSSSAYLVEAGRLCGPTVDLLDKIPDASGRDLAARKEQAKLLSRVLRPTIAALLSLPVPPADQAGFGARTHALLTRTPTIPDVIDTFVRTGDLAALPRASADEQQAADAYRSYGSETCALMLENPL